MNIILDKIKIYVRKKMDKKDGISKKLLLSLNNHIFHQDQKYGIRHLGFKNQDKVFYVIRPTSDAEGLLSLFFTVMRNIMYAEEKGMIPVVDFENFSTQYKSDLLINNSHNAWNYYFSPISKYKLSDIYQSKNVYFSGWGRPEIKDNIFKNDFSEIINEKRKKFIYSHTCIQKNVKNEVERFQRELFCKDKILGVYVRGTDYIKLQPKSHPIQPPVEDVLKQVEIFVSKYNIKKIFIVTEDFKIFSKFKNIYGEMVFSTDDFYIKDYKDNYVYTCLSDQEPYEKGMRYLVKMLLLNECNYLISTLTNGSLFSLAINTKAYEDKYIFNLGKY